MPGEIGFGIGVSYSGLSGRVGDCRFFLEVNAPDPETQSTASLRSAAMGQD